LLWLAILRLFQLRRRPMLPGVKPGLRFRQSPGRRTVVGWEFLDWVDDGTQVSANHLSLERSTLRSRKRRSIKPLKSSWGRKRAGIWSAETGRIGSYPLSLTAFRFTSKPAVSRGLLARIEQRAVRAPLRPVCPSNLLPTTVGAGLFGIADHTLFVWGLDRYGHFGSLTFCNT